MLVKLEKLVAKVSNFGAVGDGSIKGIVGKIGEVSNFGAVGDGSDKSNAGKVGKTGQVSNFGAVGDGSIKDNVGKIGKVSNFGAVGDGSDKGNAGKIGKVSTPPSHAHPLLHSLGSGFASSRSELERILNIPIYGIIHNMASP